MARLVWFVVGTRPEATKGWLLAKELARIEGVNLRIIFSGQHKQLLEDCLQDLGRIDGVDFDTGPILTSFIGDWRPPFRERINALLRMDAPAVLCLLGDTDTVRISAEAAASLGICVAHVEAGIRHRGQYDRPEPEETNRREVSRLATIHFAPTLVAADNLRSEGISSQAVHLIGDLSYCAIASAFVGLVRRIATGVCGEVDRTTGPYALCTFHRSTSLWQQDRLAAHLEKTVSHRAGLTFVIVTRPDTRWADFYRAFSAFPNVEIIPALTPSEFLAQMLQCEILLTDSAGVQQEGLILGKHVIGCRRETELYADHPRLQLVPPPFPNLLEAIDKVWPLGGWAYRGDTEPMLSSVCSEGLRIAKEVAWHIHNAIH